MLLPGQPIAHPLAVGFIYPGDETVHAEALLHCLREAVAQLVDDHSADSAQVLRRFPTAA